MMTYQLEPLCTCLRWTWGLALLEAGPVYPEGSGGPGPCRHLHFPPQQWTPGYLAESSLELLWEIERQFSIETWAPTLLILSLCTLVFLVAKTDVWLGHTPMVFLFV